MSKRQKAIDRLLSRPSDYEWAELAFLMEAFGYELKTSGGSARKFIHRETRATLFMHQPHPTKILKAYQVREAIHFLKQEKHIP
ncbi:MAG: type II toxin-antitoxin system HicA family toxin [Silvibacterium sp.]